MKFPLNKSGMILFSAGLLALASLCATSGVSWMLPLLIHHYGQAAYNLTFLPPFASAVGLLLAPLFARWLTPVRVITGGFIVMCLAFALLTTLPLLGIAFAASVVIGLVAVGIGSIHTAAPARAGVSPEEASSTVNGVFTIGTFFATYGIAKAAVSLGPSGGLGALSLITATAALGAWLLFGRKSLPTATPQPVPTTPLRLRDIWSKQVVAVMLLAASNKVAIGACLTTLSVVLSNTRTFADPIWLAVINGAAIPAGLLMLTIWRKHSPQWSDNGLMRAACATLGGSLVLLLTLGPVGIWWMAAQWVGIFGLFVGAAYEQGAYSAIHDQQGGKKTLVNFGIAGGFTAGVWLGNWVVGSQHFLPVVIAVPAAFFSLAATLIAQPWLRRWVAEKRAAEASTTATAQPSQAPQASSDLADQQPAPNIDWGVFLGEHDEGVTVPAPRIRQNYEDALEIVQALRADLNQLLEQNRPLYEWLKELLVEVRQIASEGIRSLPDKRRALDLVVELVKDKGSQLDQIEQQAYLRFSSQVAATLPHKPLPSEIFQAFSDELTDLERRANQHEQSSHALTTAGTALEILEALEMEEQWLVTQIALIDEFQRLTGRIISAMESLTRSPGTQQI